MPNDTITLIIDAKNLASAQLKGLQKDMRGLDDAGQKSNAMMERGGNIAKGILAAGIATAGYAAVQFAGDSVAAFRDEQVGIERLGASLKANVKDWDGNTAAIEKQIGAMVRTTGFSDGEMRDSLARLVASTHDVAKGFDLQRTAMDLARFKGIGLEEASAALIKVEGGQYRALKELGVVLEKGASQTEALAAVQKVAGGQMAAYMETAAGKSAVLDNRLGDLQETLGEKLSPRLADATEWVLKLMDALDSDVPQTFERRVMGIADAFDFLNPKIAQSSDLKDAFDAANANSAIQAERDAIYEAAKAWDTYSESASGPINNVAREFRAEGPKWYSATLANMAQVEKGIHDGAAGVAQAMRDALSDRNREADAADQIIVNSAEIAAQKRIIADKKATAAQKAEARIRLRALRADNKALEAEMELLVNKGYTYGRGFTLGFVRGLVKDTDRVGESARVLARTVKKYLQVHSPSEAGPFSEMGGPDGWGSRFGSLWAGGLARTAGLAGSAANRYAGAVAMPGGAGLGMSAPMAVGGSGGGVTLVVNSAFPPSPQQIREWTDVIEGEMTRRGPAFSPYGS